MIIRHDGLETIIDCGILMLVAKCEQAYREHLKADITIVCPRNVADGLKICVYNSKGADFELSLAENPGAEQMAKLSSELNQFCRLAVILKFRASVLISASKAIWAYDTNQMELPPFLDSREDLEKALVCLAQYDSEKDSECIDT